MRETPWFFGGAGVTNSVAREVCWERTPLGPCSGWSTSLKATVAMLFHARLPMFVWWGPELVQLYNDAYLPSFGRGKHPAAMGQPGRDCWQEIWPIIWPQIEDVMSRGKSSWNEDHLVPIERNGRIEEVYWTYSYCPVFDDDGSIGGTLVICTETTPRVVAERRLRMLRTLGDRTSLAADPAALTRSVCEAVAEFGADIPFAVSYAGDPAAGDPRVVDHVGLPAGASILAGPPRAALLAALRDPTPRLVALADLVDPVAGAGPVRAGPRPAAVEHAWLTPLSAVGARAPGLVLLGLSPRLPFDDTYRQFLNDLLEHLAVACTRIAAEHARAATQRERDNLLLHAPVATALLTGPEHLFELANPLYCQMVGRSDLVGQTYLGAFPELQGTPLPGILDRVYRTGEAFTTGEQWIPIDADGDGVVEDHYFKFNLEPLRDPSGSIYGMMAVAVDITAQVGARRAMERAGDEREKLLAALEAASRVKDEFLAMLGHELRNPLAPIVTALQVIKHRGAGTLTREHHIIERQVNHLVRLVDDLLDVARITRGEIELRREPTDVAAVVAKAIEMADYLLDKRGHRLTLDLPTGPLLCDGDPVRVAQIVANLLTNAARYTDPGGHIGLSARAEAGQVVIRVKDDGIGISAELLPRLFDLFVQGKRATDRSEGGLGIGLALVKNLVAMHGGEVLAVSEGPGRGSEFIVRLPLAGAAQERPRPAEPVAGASTGRVLVVDDNVDAAEVIGILLASFGYEVALAHDAFGALDRVASFRPDVAILDIGLPVIDGYELAGRIRADPRNAACRIFALSGYGRGTDPRASEGAFEHHFLKPVDIDELVAYLQRGALTRQ